MRPKTRTYVTYIPQPSSRAPYTAKPRTFFCRGFTRKNADESQISAGWRQVPAKMDESAARRHFFIRPIICLYPRASARIRGQKSFSTKVAATRTHSGIYESKKPGARAGLFLNLRY